MSAVRRKSRNLSSERGEGEMHFFMLVVMGAIFFSGAVWLLDWIKDVKHARYHRTHEVSDEDKPAPFDPNGQAYVVVY